MTNFETHEIKLIETLGAIVALWLIRWFVRWVIGKRSKVADFTKGRSKIMFKAINIFYFAVFVTVAAGIWGLKGISILTFITSVLTVLGVGFFAQWSLLSNITSGLILYFNHPMKIGDYIKIIDKDMPLAGCIDDISLFFIHIRDEEGVEYTLPNTTVMQKTLTISREPFEVVVTMADRED